MAFPKIQRNYGLRCPGCKQIFDELSSKSFLSLQIISGVVIYALLWLLFRREDIVEFKDLLFGR